MGQLTLKQLQAENKKLKQMRVKINQLERNNKDRQDLAKENKRLSRDIKFRKSKRLTDKATKIIGTAGIKSGRVLARAGTKVFRRIQQYGRFLEEQERKQKSKNRKLKTVKRTKRR